ncbi:MAG: hypothetical protein ACPG4W_01775 [Flavobacteriales bacterium]
MNIKSLLILLLVSTSLKAQIYLLDVEQSGWVTEFSTSVNESTTNAGVGGAYVFNGGKSISLSYNEAIFRGKRLVKTTQPSFNILINKKKRKFNAQLSVFVAYNELARLRKSHLNYGFGARLNRIFKIKSVQLIPAFQCSLSSAEHFREDSDSGYYYGQLKYTVGGLSLGFYNTIMVKRWFVDLGLFIVNGIDPNYNFSVGYKILKR